MTTADAGLLGPKSKPVRALRRLSGRRRARSEEGAFVIDGPTLCAEALRDGLDVRTVFVEVDEDGAIPDTLAAIAGDAAAAGADVVFVAAGILAKAVDPVTPQRVAAIAGRPADRPIPGAAGLVVVAVGISDPGNLGTIVRLAEAAGASAVVSTGDGVDPWSPKCVRASAGSVFRLPIVLVDAERLVDDLRDAGYFIVASDLVGGKAPEDVDLTAAIAVLIGNEAHGLPAEMVARVDAVITIPMAGSVESLNAAAAGAVILFESARQRRARLKGTESST